MSGFIDRLADAGEEAIAKLAQAPGMNRVAGTAAQLTELIQDLQRRLNGVDKLGTRVQELERRVEELERARAHALADAPPPQPPSPPGPPPPKPHPGAEAAREAAPPPAEDPAAAVRATMATGGGADPEDPGVVPGP